MVEFTLHYILHGFPSINIADSPTASSSPPAPLEQSPPPARTQKPSRSSAKPNPKNRSRKCQKQMELSRRLMEGKNTRFCSYCKNHGISNITLGHRKLCENRNCVCLPCLSVREKHTTMRKQVAEKREKDMDDLRAKFPQYFQQTGGQKKQSVDGLFQGDGKGSQSAYLSLWNTMWTLLTRFDLRIDTYPILYLILKEVSSDVEIVCQKIFQCKNEIRTIMENMRKQGEWGADDMELCFSSKDSSPALLRPLTLPNKQHISNRAQMRGQTKRRAQKKRNNGGEEELPSGNYQAAESKSTPMDVMPIGSTSQSQGPAAKEMIMTPSAGWSAYNSFVGNPLILGHDSPPVSVSSPDKPPADERERANSNPPILDDPQVLAEEGTVQKTFMNQTSPLAAPDYVKVVAEEGAAHQTFLNRTGPLAAAAAAATDYGEVTSAAGNERSGPPALTPQGGLHQNGGYAEQVSPVSFDERGQQKLTYRGGPRRMENYPTVGIQRDFMIYHVQETAIPFQSYPMFIHEIPTIQ